MPRFSMFPHWLRALSGVAAAAALNACTSAAVTVTPITPQVATPIAIGPLATDTEPPSPTVTVDATQIAQLTAVTATPAPTDTPAPTATPNVSPTSIIALPPTDTPTATITPTASPVPTNTATPSRTARGTAAATSAMSNPGNATATRPPQSGTAPKPLPAGVLLTRDYDVINAGGDVIGTPNDMRDARELTWASLRGQGGAWVLTLREVRRVVGLRLFPQKDGATETTVALTRVEVSADGKTWQDAYVPNGTCGSTPNCLAMTPQVYQEIGFAPVEAQYVRLTSGPTRFAFGEIEIAIAP